MSDERVAALSEALEALLRAPALNLDCLEDADIRAIEDAKAVLGIDSQSIRQTTTTHTPGPWETRDIAFRHNYHEHVVGRAGYMPHAIVFDRSTPGQATDECVANARLIASSPRLATLLHELLEICRVKCSPTDEPILPNGRTNHDAMVDACQLLKHLGIETQ